MPYSFTQIEKDKTSLVSFIFTFLVFFYFISFQLIYWVSVNLIAFQTENLRQPFHIHSLNPYEILLTFVFALVVGVLHWYLSTTGLVDKIVGLLKAEYLDNSNPDHMKFKNILEEVSVATGGAVVRGVVIPTMGMNAFALADFESTPVIGVTQGLLLRLSRSQLEAVVAHEAAHVAQGDCLVATVSSSLFGIFNTILKGFGQTVSGAFLSNEGRGDRDDADDSIFALLQLLRVFPSTFIGIILLFFIYIFITFATFVSYIFRMLISREREFRADAIAVRLTRDPLSLAEALYIMAHRWRGAGAPWDVLDTIFIMNPSYGTLDEEEGWGADLFATHPPVKKRIDILLDIAHHHEEALKEVMDRFNERYKDESMVSSNLVFNWFLLKDQQWVGPLSLAEISQLSWFTPQTMVKRFGSEKIVAACDDKTLADLLRSKGLTDIQKPCCPRCQCGLSGILYEGVNILTCFQCKGTLLDEDQVGVVLYRHNSSFGPRIVQMAQVIGNEQKLSEGRALQIWPCPSDIHCPKCRNIRFPMGRRLFNVYFHVEIDKCGSCGAVWFDRDELEVLQCLSEQAQGA